MIAVVYIGQRRHADITAKNHKKFLDVLAKKYSYHVYDFTHEHRTWSTQGLCGEQAQILDMHHALRQVSESVVIKIRTDTWICPWEIDNIASLIEQVVDNKLDFAYIGPYLCLDVLDREKTITTNVQDPRWVQDVMVIFQKQQTNDVEWLFQHLPETKNYSDNRGWYMMAKNDSVCKIVHCDVYIVRKSRSRPCDYQIVEDWYNQVLDSVQGTWMFDEHLQRREQWRLRYKDKAHEDTILEQ